MMPPAYLLAALVFAIDQLSKYAVIHVLHLPEQLQIELLPVLSLTWVENSGVSMGLLTAGSEFGRWLLVLLTAGIALVVAVWAWRSRAKVENAALGLVLGGALGNILDRIRLGYVVDFIHVHAGPLALPGVGLHIPAWSFYVFNVADAAITIGVAILLLFALTGRSDGKPERLTDA